MRVSCYDGVVYGNTGGTIPDHRRLTLIGDAARRQIGPLEIGRSERRRRDSARVGPDLCGIMFDQPGAGEDLLVLDLLGTDHSPAVIEIIACQRRALIDCCHILAAGFRHAPILARAGPIHADPTQLRTAVRTAGPGVHDNPTMLTRWR